MLSTRAIDDPEVATFLARWLYEETFHGRALARFLAAAGAWPDFVGVHFYYRQAALRLRKPRAAQVTHFLVDRFWAPVGTGVQPASETRFLAAYLFGGPDGRAAVCKVDEQIRRLTGVEDVALLEA